MTRILEVAGVVLLLNLPFGYLRAGVRKFSVPWFITVHAGIPLVVALRFATGIGWRFVSFPIFIGAYAMGHLLGGKFRAWRTRTG